MSDQRKLLLKQRYDQQVLVPEIGAVGQRRLRNSSVLVVGCGGLGSSVIPILAASGIGRLVLCDNDTVKVSNLNRQTIYKEMHIGQSKVEIATKFVEELNSDVQVSGLNTAMGPNNFDEILRGIDVVVDCADRLAIKIFLNDVCVVKNIALIHSVAIGFEGEIMYISPGGKPCYRCFFEEWPISTDLNCAQSGVAGSTVGVVGSMAASEVIKHIVGITQPNYGKLYRVNLLKNRFITYEFKQNLQCVCCGEKCGIDPYDRESYENKLRTHCQTRDGQ